MIDLARGVGIGPAISLVIVIFVAGLTLLSFSGPDPSDPAYATIAKVARAVELSKVASPQDVTGDICPAISVADLTRLEDTEPSLARKKVFSEQHTDWAVGVPMRPAMVCYLTSTYNRLVIVSYNNGSCGARVFIPPACDP